MVFILFGTSEREGGSRKSAQMCKKLNSKRLHGGECGKSFHLQRNEMVGRNSMCLLMETSITSHLPNECALAARRL